jgi:alpha-N-arabinofuranosidase
MLQNLSWNRFVANSSKFILVLSLAAPVACAAQNMIVYDDSLENGWLNYGWATLNYANTSPVHSGSDSISVTIASAYAGIQLYHTDLSSSAYASISFWLNGGSSGGQQLQIYGLEDLGGTNNFGMSTRYQLNTPTANTWQQYTVPLSALGVANVANFTGFVIQDSAGSAESTFYLDDIQLVGAAGPALTHLTANAGLPIRTADARWFGMNAAQWDGAFDTPQTVTQLTNMGTRVVRIPGGSRSDDYHWVSNKSVTDNITWATSVASFIHVMTNANVQGMITVNYGTGTSNEAAAWVAYCNASTSSPLSLGTDSYGVNWQTAGYWASLRAAAPLGSNDGKNFLRLSRTAPVGFKYWEIGNEEYGASWEVDSNSLPHDPYTYGVRAAGYITLMRAVDPTIKIGVVATPGEDSYANGYSSHPAYNSRTATSHNGWTPVVLATLKSLGVTPDFIIHHRYAQNPGGESDAGLLASSAGWASDAANLRQMISDYVGSNGTNIEMVCTENNSVSSNPGKQSVSLVNGLFMADSLAQMMQTEFNGLFWWNLRNGSDSTTGNNSSSLYGWRQYGDYGVLEGTDYYPPYYAARLMQDFVQPGDTVISAASDYSLLSTYAVRRQNGSLTILTINKDPVNTLTGQVAVAGFSPAPNGTIYSYGIPQDTAAQTSTGSPDVAQSSFSFTGTNFNYSFPPYSATVMVLASAAVPPQLKGFSLSGNGSFSFAFTNFTGLNFTVLSTTNLALPVNAWSNLGAAVESPAGSGQFQFTDPQATNLVQRFYRVRSP